MHQLQQYQALSRKPTKSGQMGWGWQHPCGRQAPVLQATAGSCRLGSGFPKTRVLTKQRAVLRLAATEGLSPLSRGGSRPGPAGLASVGCAGTAGSPHAAAGHGVPPGP